MSKLNIKELSNYDELSKVASEIIFESFKNNPEGLFCIAGGDTPVGAIKLFIEKVKAENLDVSKAKFIGLDEWVGLDGSDQGSCRQYLNDNLYTPLNINVDNILFFDGRASDLELECTKANKFIEQHGPIVLNLLGVGVNGHLGFNEPNSPLDKLAYVTELDETTQTVGAKYFDGKIDAKYGLTLSVKQIMASENLLIMANGASKTAAINATKTGKYDPNYTVTVVNDHPSATLLYVK